MFWKNAHARSRSRMAVAGLLAVMLLVISAGSALAAQRIMFIFDASGSMWGQIDGKAKIEIAREAFADLIQTVPDDAEVGLVAYANGKPYNADVYVLDAQGGQVDNRPRTRTARRCSNSCPAPTTSR